MDRLFFSYIRQYLSSQVFYNGHTIWRASIKAENSTQATSTMLEMDTALLSKIPRGNRPIKKQQICLLALYLKLMKTN